MRKPRTVTMQDIASTAGVSVSTVSRALRYDASVAIETAERVRDVAARLDYRLDERARRMRRDRTQAVAVAVPALNDWYFAKVLSGVERTLSEQGFETVVAVISGPDAVDRVLSDSATSGRVDGVIVIDMRLSPATSQTLIDHEVVAVTTGRSFPNFSSVMIDDAAAAQLATAHLIGLGHREIGVIKGNDGGPFGFDVPHRRLRGYLRALDAAGIPRTSFEAVGNFALEGGYDAAMQLCTRDDGPTALFCMSDRMALGAIHALQDLGRTVPDEVSVIGIDDHDVSELLGLTTIRQPVDSIGALAAAALIEDLQPGRTGPRHHTLPIELVVRRTTRRLPT